MASAVVIQWSKDIDPHFSMIPRTDNVVVQCCVLVGVVFMVIARHFKIRDVERKRLESGSAEKAPKSRNIV